MSKSSQLDHIVGQAYDCLVDDHAWGGLLASCADLVGGESALVYLKPQLGSDGVLLTSCGFDPSYKVGRYLSYYEQRSPLIGYFRHQPEGLVRPLGDYAFSAAYRKTEYFEDWVRPQGCGDILGAHLVRTPEVYAWLSIRRSDRRGTYSSTEIRHANCIARHLNRAIKLRSTIERERTAHESLRQSLEAVAFGILIVDSNAKIIVGNSVSDAILREGDGIKQQFGRVVCNQAQNTSMLHAAIRAAASGFDPDIQVKPDLYVPCGNADRFFTLHVLPIPSTSGWQGIASSPGKAAVFIIDSLAVSVDVERFAAVHNLTRAELRLLHEIVRRGGLVLAAEKLRIAVPTARTHLQHIFEKTNTKSQADLVRLVMMSPLKSRLARH